ncbi:phosphatidylserine decarboxylase [Sediminispirochaeta bajacaliforniensis]|uniref:phosphatidylserine decarboxylase n=1 Tax=Sediminispirochaeta bajacaliforniensis TaxID=148 RepID=UPI00035F7460|nr:phosphatidylserine decarboxylase [Sediminispirochaeta bajacaliforniensis]
MEDRIMQFFYKTTIGRLFINLLLKAGLPKVMAAYLRSPLSKHLIPRYIKKHRIPMRDFPEISYRSFAEFFSRRKEFSVTDPNPSHFSSPCDGLLSAYSILPDSSFAIKNSHYRLCDLIDDTELAKRYCNGLCLIFRLTAADYHHYSFVDDGYIGKNHLIEGTLHSVQPIACDAFPVYRLNRRCWKLLDTDHFGPIIQIEIGALAVGGIVNEYEETSFEKGTVMGHFELCGSTIVLLIQKEKIRLLSKIETVLAAGDEFRVTQGMWIASKPNTEHPEPPTSDKQRSG